MVHINERTEESYVLINCLYITDFILRALTGELTKFCCWEARSAEFFGISGKFLNFWSNKSCKMVQIYEKMNESHILINC